MKQSKTVRRTAGVAGDNVLRSVQGGGTPLPSIIGDDDLRRGPIEGTPLPA